MDEESPRERLFDVLMRRLELLAPHKEAVRSLLRSARRNPPLALALNGHGGALAAMDADRRRHRRVAARKGMVRAQGLALLFAHVLRTWVDDDDPGLARTLAALDRELARGQRWAGLLDDLCRIPQAACNLGSGCAAPARPATAADAKDRVARKLPRARLAGLHRHPHASRASRRAGCRRA